MPWLLRCMLSEVVVGYNPILTQVLIMLFCPCSVHWTPLLTLDCRRAYSDRAWATTVDFDGPLFQSFDRYALPVAKSNAASVLHDCSPYLQSPFLIEIAEQSFLLRETPKALCLFLAAHLCCCNARNRTNSN